MGTFGGHTLPGSFFIAFALWWLPHQFMSYFSSLQTGRNFRSKISYSNSLISNMPIESIVKIVLPFIALVIEAITGWRGSHVIPGNTQHITMYTGFIMLGVTEVLLYRKVIWLPYNADYAVGVMAFVMELVLFYFHQPSGHSCPGMTPKPGMMHHSLLEVKVHQLLILCIAATIVVIIMEASDRHSFVLTLMRSWLVLFQGCWFWSVAFVLYPPWNQQHSQWDLEDHGSVMYVTALFCFNGFGSLFVVGAIGYLCSLRVGYTPLPANHESSGGGRPYSKLPANGGARRPSLDDPSGLPKGPLPVDPDADEMELFSQA